MSLLSDINPFRTTADNMRRVLRALEKNGSIKHRIGPGQSGLYQAHRQIAKRAASTKSYNRMPQNRPRGMYVSPAYAERAIARLAAWMTSHPDGAPKDCPAHIRRNAARAQTQLKGARA